MKTRNKINSNKANLSGGKQVFAGGTHNEFISVGENTVLFENTRQLYATEAEDYFFYFQLVSEKNRLGIAI